MSYNPEKPQFWQPFSLPGVYTFGLHPQAPPVRSHMHPGNYIRALQGIGARDIVYPEYNDDDPIHDLLGFSGFAITSYLQRLRDIHPDTIPDIPTDEEGQTDEQGAYQHTFVWRDGGSLMVDIWRSTLDESTYPTATVRVFRDLDEVDPNEYGHAGGNTLIVLGEEEKYRRKLAKVGKKVEEFAHRTRQSMPEYPEGFIAYARHRRC